VIELESMLIHARSQIDALKYDPIVTDEPVNVLFSLVK
jgi:hypothetical protein